MTIFFLSLLFSSLTFAGNSVGNGGDVMVCGSKLEILDLFEAKDLYKRIPQESNLKVEEILKERLGLLEKFSPILKNLYEKKLLAYRINVLENVKLQNLKDENNIYIPKSCKLQQIAHKVNSNNAKFDLYINAEYWKKLNNLNRAALLMHEVVYDHFRFFGVSESAGVRQLVGMIFAKDFETMSKKELKEFFLNQRVPLD